MNFKIKNNQVFFRDYDLSEQMEIKEINVDVENNVSFVTAEFKADIDVSSKGVLFAMVENMDKANALDLFEHLKARLEDE